MPRSKFALKYGDDVAAFAANIGGAVGAATTRYRDGRCIVNDE